jgi:hypothetical protein
MENMMDKKGRGYFTYLILLLVLTIGFAVQQNPDFPIDKLKDNLNWTHVDINVTESPDLENAFESLINGLGDAIFSIGKWAAQWSSENPTVPFKLLIYLVIFSILAPSLIVLFKFLVIIFILSKEFVLSRREKREITKNKLIKGGLNEEESTA